MMRRRKWALLTGAAILVVLVVLATTGGADTPRRAAVSSARVDPHAAKEAALPPPLKSHPRVVIAATPDQLPPGAHYVNANEAETFHPPSDAEVRAELHQLNVGRFSGSGGYVNPFSQIANLKPLRIDMGVDYSGAGPVLAIGSGTVFSNSGPGWPGGGFVGVTLDSGSLAGKSYFIAESVRATVKVGQHVQAGQQIATMFEGPSAIETGWATGQGDQPLALTLHQQAPGDPGGWTSAAGLSFDRLLVSVGVVSGVPQGTAVHGKMPAGYP
jgi:murein DD-endopeptidase MepM/ murein hydrolase activator NlpD